MGDVRADQVIELYADLEAHGVALWLTGGWGVDALIGRQTREHHDLDVLVDVRSLERLAQRLAALGYQLRRLWPKETWWVQDPSWTQQQERPTAFVLGHPDGRELDVHVVRMEGDELADVLWTAPYRFPRDGLQGRGLVAGRPVRCLTAAMQRLAHAGYELPATHRADLELLAGETG